MNDNPAQEKPDLSIVMPVFNEAGIVGSVVESWIQEAERLGISWEFLIYDAESSDGTLDILAALAEKHPGIQVNVCPRLPHGPSVTRGYREASAPWVMQIDSDDEMGPEAFEQLWTHRNDHDFLLGCRTGRESPLARRIVTQVSRLAVLCLYGKGVRDVNSPYRLIRRSMLDQLLAFIPPETTVPNVILSGLVATAHARIYQCDVNHRSRRVGTAPLTKFSLWAVAARALRETWTAARRSKSADIQWAKGDEA